MRGIFKMAMITFALMLSVTAQVNAETNQRTEIVYDNYADLGSCIMITANTNDFQIDNCGYIPYSCYEVNMEYVSDITISEVEPAIRDVSVIAVDLPNDVLLCGIYWYDDIGYVSNTVMSSITNTLSQNGIHKQNRWRCCLYPTYLKYLR